MSQIGGQAIELTVLVFQTGDQFPGIGEGFRRSTEQTDGTADHRQFAGQPDQGVDPLHIHPQGAGRHFLGSYLLGRPRALRKIGRHIRDGIGAGGGDIPATMARMVVISGAGSPAASTPSRVSPVAGRPADMTQHIRHDAAGGREMAGKATRLRDIQHEMLSLKDFAAKCGQIGHDLIERRRSQPRRGRAAVSPPRQPVRGRIEPPWHPRPHPRRLVSSPPDASIASSHRTT